jgi:hypothetical protein
MDLLSGGVMKKMRKIPIGLIATGMILVLAVVWVAPTQAAGPVCTVNGSGGADYLTIGAAIADAGCATINVAAGVYTENLTIDRDVTLQGAGADVTIIDGNGAVTLQRVITITYDQTVNIADVTIQHGHAETATNGGGGISNRGALTLNRVILTNNEVVGTDSGDVGGAISPGGTGGGSLVMDNCVVSNNMADRGGGIFFNSTMKISNTLIYNNSARSGGGITNYDSMTLTNITLSNNTGSSGPGGIVNNGDGTIINSTITGNNPRGLNNYGTISLTNTILSGNSPENCFASSPITSAGYNLENGDSCDLGVSGDIINTDPQLGTLQDNGGFSWTHALLAGSAAIDAGINVSCPVADQRGVWRRYDGDQNGTLICDMGAFEFDDGLNLFRILDPFIIKP